MDMQQAMQDFDNLPADVRESQIQNAKAQSLEHEKEPEYGLKDLSLLVLKYRK